MKGKAAPSGEAVITNLSCLSANDGTSSRRLLERTKCLREPARADKLFGIRV